MNRQANILVMDDEYSIREVVRTALTMAGYETDTAESGEEAVAKYTRAKEESKPYDAVIFDLTVPGTRLYILFQVSGDYTFDTGGLPATDIDIITGYGHPAHLTNLMVSAEHPFFHEKMRLRISGVYMAEANSYTIAPDLTYDLLDDLQLGITGAFYGGEEKDYSLFSFWEDNDYLQIGLHCSF